MRLPGYWSVAHVLSWHGSCLLATDLAQGVSSKGLSEPNELIAVSTTFPRTSVWYLGFQHGFTKEKKEISTNSL